MEFELEALLGQPASRATETGRWDVPQLQPQGRASIQLAMQAAMPNNRKRSLEALEASLPAKSTGSRLPGADL